MISRRLDEELVARRLVPSRARARDAVNRGLVSVDGAAARKPSQPVSEKSALSVDDRATRYVSRAALKLVHGLDHFKIAVRDRICVDLGASTGGFTQVLLERGAAQVTAIDVGHGQMAPEIEGNRRVRLFEGVNARDVTRQHVPEDTSLVVCDVSFISLKLALPPALALLKPGAAMIVLIKPQFEVGREGLGKGGVVRDEALLRRVCEDISAFVEQLGWAAMGITPSPLAGGDGNTEYLLGAIKR